MHQLKIVVITAPRSKGEDYLPATLADMAAQDASVTERPCGVFSDSLVLPAGLQPWLNHVQCATAEQLKRRKDEELFGTPNLQRALRWAGSDTRFVCCLEDDVRFAGDWATRALAICERLVARGRPWLLTLQHFLRHEGHFDRVDAVDGAGEIMRWNESGPLFGSQGFMMLASTAYGMADIWDEKMRLPAPERRWWMMDEGIWRMAAGEHRFGIYAPNPALIDHVGDVSSVFEWEKLRPGRMSTYFDVDSRKCR